MENLTRAQLRDLAEIHEFVREHPTWTVCEYRTTKPLVIAGCLERAPTGVVVTDVGLAVLKHHGLLKGTTL